MKGNPPAPSDREEKAIQLLQFVYSAFHFCQKLRLRGLKCLVLGKSNRCKPALLQAMA